MKEVSIETLTTFEKWVKPTFQEVENVIENIDFNVEEITSKFGINERTLRRWTSKQKTNRLEKSSIPYGVWCVFVALSTNKFIFGNALNGDLSKIPNNYICSFKNFESPPKDILISFVGKSSITGLQRNELAKIFGWNPAYLGREFNKGKINFLNWVLILLLCGVKIEKLINIK